MIYVLIIAGGLFNLYRVSGQISKQSDEEAPYKTQAYAMAFAMGCVIIGLPLALIYWLIF